MKKRFLAAALAMTLLLAGCGEKDKEVVNGESIGLGIGETQAANVTPGTETPATVDDGAEEEEEEVLPPGKYRSELTNEIIDDDIKNQRPIAVMVDNEVTALDHFGVNEADIVYEIMNSTMNDRVTRLMCIVKDWTEIKQFGSVRSTRPTNFMLAAEYNAILCHDGGPYYINNYIAKDYTNNLSGGFARFSNGKATEFTEYITYEGYTNPNTGKSYDGLGKRIDSAGYTREYNEYYPGEHFEFTTREQNLSSDYGVLAKKAEKVKLPFKHNGSELHYNPDTKTYEYYEYNRPHVDALHGNEVTSFKNVIIQKCSFAQLDSKGYLVYNVLVSTPWDGYYLTNGEAVPISWTKTKEDGLTDYRNAAGNPLVLSTGKTYITLVPDDSWDKLVIE
ncbi:MAG: DUF3048 domain-containing protein [Lachnospiraceae bacterium]|nr:DUF3048 domain-containing protein [Lachnospiraceae bacterium]